MNVERDVELKKMSSSVRMKCMHQNVFVKKITKGFNRYKGFQLFLQLFIYLFVQ